jgi:NitT/TauT family transport system substrate-binding protein
MRRYWREGGLVKRGVHVVFGAVLALALVASACGDDDDSSGAAAPSASTTASSSSPSPSSSASSAPTTGSADPLAPQPLATRATVKVGIPIQTEVFTPSLLAQELGEMEKENLSVTTSVIPTQEGLVLLDKGDLDVYIGSPTAGFFNALAQGLQIRWASATNNFDTTDPIGATNKIGIWLRSDYFGADGKVDPTKLKGAKIGLGAAAWGGVDAAELYTYLKANGLQPSDVNAVSQPSDATAVVALEQKNLDGAVVSYPFYQQLEEKGTAKLWLTYPDKATLVGSFIGPNLRDKSPDVAQAFFRATARTVRDHMAGDYHSNAETVKALAKVLDLPESSMSGPATLVFDPSMAIDPTATLAAQDAWLAVGGILKYQTPYAPEQFIDTQYIDAYSNIGQ